jgi:hypothetical protein
MTSDHLLPDFMILDQKGKYTKGLNIVRMEGVNSAKLEILIRIEVPAKGRIRMGR